jgi:hypothetical protein
MKFRLKKGCGSHVEQINGKDKVFVAGEIVESETDLCKRFVNKFERVHEVVAPVAQPEIPVPGTQSSQPVPSDAEVGADNSAPPQRDDTDVTSSFPIAEKNGLQVLKRTSDGLFEVLKDSNVMNEGPFNADDLEKFLEPLAKTKG